MAERGPLLEIATPLGFIVSLSHEHWAVIQRFKHRDMSGRLAEVQLALAEPDEVRLSRRDPNTYLFYRVVGTRRFICAVTRVASGSGTLATVYETARVKQGVLVWPR